MTAFAKTLVSVSFPLHDFVAVCDEGTMKSAGDTGENFLEETKQKSNKLFTVVFSYNRGCVFNY